jgi:hypothetical protein
MAAVAGDAGDALPAAGGAPLLALQLPFGADPGSLTEWLLADTSSSPPAEVVSSMTDAFARYGALPAEADARYAVEFQALSNEVLSSVDLCSFLTVFTTPGEAPVVTVVSALSIYSAGFGARSTHVGKVFGFLGETTGTQLPPIVQAPDVRTLFSVRESSVPTPVQLQTHFANPEAGLLMPSPDGAVPVSFARLVFVPKAWAPYFLGRLTPYMAYKTGVALVAALPTAALREGKKLLHGWIGLPLHVFAREMQ